VDRLHHPSAKPGQIGRDCTGVPEFFSMDEEKAHSSHTPLHDQCLPEIKNPVQTPFWAGF